MRQHAAELVQGLTGSPEGIAQLSSRADHLLPPLFRLVGDGPFSQAALTSLVNLSQQPLVHQKLLAMNGPARCMDYIKEMTCHGFENMLVMLLANLSAEEDGAAALLQLDKPGMEGYNIAILLKYFLEVSKHSSSSSETVKGEEKGDTYEHVASILPNVTRFDAARRLLLEPGRGTMKALASQLRSPSSLRRRGCSGAIKNCCFSCEEDGTTDMLVAESDALADVLGVLAGIPTVEEDAIVRENLAEAILCLAKVPTARKELWRLNAPELLRKAYEHEENPGVCEAMEATAEFFLSDGLEPGEEQVRGIEELQRLDDMGKPLAREVHIDELD